MIFLVVPAIIVLLFLLTPFFGAPYVPSKHRDIDEALTELYRISDQDTLVDVGSGDGAVLRSALDHGARSAIGYEINLFLVLISKISCRKYPSATTVFANFLRTEFPSETTIVYIFGVEHLMDKLRTKIEKSVSIHHRTIYLISYGFELKTKKPLRRRGAYFLYEFVSS